MIDSLSYIGFTSPAADEWKTFGPDVLGLQLADDRGDGSVRLRCDDAVQRIVVHPGETNDLAYLGWAVTGPEQLTESIARVEAAGLPVERGDAALAADRRVVELASFTDPFGFRHELSWGLMTRPASFRPGRPMSGFVTGDGGLGHAVLIVPDLASATRFYTDVLGFRLSDHIEVGISLRFFHCNSRHHTIALSSAPGMVGVHHLMLEVQSLDDVGTALDICTRDGIPLAMTMGRHTNDLMTSFYARTPSGFEVEYGWGGALVDVDRPWVVRTYDAISIWGHKPPADRLRPGILRPFTPTHA